MQEPITKDESLTMDRHLHMSMPMLITDNTDAKNRNDTITELLPRSSYEAESTEPIRTTTSSDFLTT